VNELRIEAGDKENEATVDLPDAPETHRIRGIRSASFKAFVMPASTQTS